MNAEIKQRKDSFLGIHFDFHARQDSPKVGGRTTEEMVQAIIDKVRPDFIQTDCKGHAGYASYPTKVGVPAPDMAKDALRIWRDVTERNNVALYIHFSGVWDTIQCGLHPDWACVGPDGITSADMTSVFGPYVDESLIPQLQEVYRAYQLDGVWIDGDCWGVQPDYRPKVFSQFLRETGILCEPPKSPGDPYYHEWMEFNREGFRRYLRHYLEVLHKTCPGFQIASNWAFSSMMPEKVSADVDFLSGDYPLNNSVNEARFEARALAVKGKPWDLMAWGFGGEFSTEKPHTFTAKTAIQLQQESAHVLAAGGGFQVYYRQEEDGHVRLWEMDIMADVAEFCRRREKFCHQSQPVKQIGLLYDGDNHYRKSRNLLSNFGNPLKGIKGALNALLDGQHCVDILHTYDDFAAFPAIFVPNATYMDDDVKKRLLAYAENGGKLILAGANMALMFKDHLQVAFAGEIVTNAVMYMEHENRFSCVLGDYAKVEAHEADILNYLYRDSDFGYEKTPAIVSHPIGKGTIAAIFCELTTHYADQPKSWSRDAVASLLSHVFPEKLVSLTGSHLVDVVVNTKNGALNIHLINMGGRHNTPMVVYDEVPPLYGLRLEVRCKAKPVEIRIEPSGKPAAFTYDGEKAVCTVDLTDIHEIITIKC